MRTGLVVIVACCLLSACSGGDHEDLRNWMRDATKDLPGKVPPLPQVQPYEAVEYSGDQMPDPFSQAKIEPEGRGRGGAGKPGGLQPDFDARDLRNNPLEKYSLETIKMIGYLNINKKPMAVLQADKVVKQVKVGDYVGLDFGVVTKITDQDVTLRELIQDSDGEWSERTSTLLRQDKEGSK
jgi:type IV pilus assembly protein PilP